MSIWILPYDPFGDDRMLYSVKNVATENERLACKWCQQNLSLYEGNQDGSKELKVLLTYMESAGLENVVDEELLQIQSIVDNVKSGGADRECAKEELKKNYALTDEAAEEYLEIYCSKAIKRMMIEMKCIDRVCKEKVCVE